MQSKTAASPETACKALITAPEYVASEVLIENGEYPTALHRSMAPHHQRPWYGKVAWSTRAPEIRQLAENVISSQEASRELRSIKGAFGDPEISRR